MNDPAALEIHPDSAIVCLTGAGVSAESGIPTFRDSGGTWEKYDVRQVATPEGFHANPDLVWRFYSERRSAARGVEPNNGHRTLAALERHLAPRGRFTLVTQNVDGLHQRAGSKRVLEVHGSLFRTRCSNDDCTESQRPYPDESLHMDRAPRCAVCGEFLRPDIVWFGEFLDPAIESSAREAIADCDLFVAVGTSGVVYPVAGYVEIAAHRGARTVLVNLEEPANRHWFREFHGGPSALVLPALFPM
jgi:NAD-dependent deacetylase